MSTRRSRIVLGVLAPFVGCAFTSGVFLPLVLVGPLFRGAITEPVYVTWAWIGVAFGAVLLLLTLLWARGVFRQARQPRPALFLIVTGLLFALFGPAALAIVAVTGRLPL